MKLSYADILGDHERHEIDAEITTEHPMSSYDQPVIVLSDDGLLDAASWFLLNYQVVQATDQEFDMLRSWISRTSLMLDEWEMSVIDALALAQSMGAKIEERAIRLAAERGDFPARKIGRDWLINKKGFEHFLAHRPKPGRK